jgi:hypothetical protein
MASVANNKLTAVKSCHNVGKSYVSAQVVAWWLSIHPVGEAFVVTSAPTAKQVRAILWKEIGRVFNAGNLKGRLNQTEWWIQKSDSVEEMVAFGSKPADVDTTAFQGIHAKYVLVVFDESCGMPKNLFDAADTLISNKYSKMLAIGNPDDPSSYFKKICDPGSGWNVITISAYDSPAFTGEDVPESLLDVLVSKDWVEDKLHRWGKKNPLTTSKIFGEFPKVSTGGLIESSWVRAAQERNLSDTHPVEIGVDVAGGGADESTIAVRKGGHVRVVHKDKNADTMQLTGRVIVVRKQYQAQAIKIDKTGIGWGASDRLLEVGENSYGVMVGNPSSEPRRFENLKAQMYWHFKNMLRDGEIDIDPEDDELAAQMLDVRWHLTSRGKIKIEDKDTLKSRGSKSPDSLEAVILSFVTPNMLSNKTAGIWGEEDETFG